VWLNHVLAIPGCLEFIVHASATRPRDPQGAYQELSAWPENEDVPPTIPDNGFHLLISIDGQPRRLHVPDSTGTGSTASTIAHHYCCRVTYAPGDRRVVVHVTWPRFHAVGEHAIDLLDIDRYVAGHRY